MDARLEPMRFEGELLRVKSRAWKHVIIIIASAILVAFFMFEHGRGGLRDPTLHDPSLDVYNETLGFGAILLISLPERTDRQDAMTLLGSVYSVKVTDVVTTVRGEQVSNKSLPFGTASTMTMPHLGSWRSHMNAFKYILDNNIESALVVEDDVDW